jgi:hypothetical protein
MREGLSGTNGQRLPPSGAPPPRAQGWRRPETTTGAPKDARSCQLFVGPRWITGRQAGTGALRAKVYPWAGGRYVSRNSFHSVVTTR